MSRSRRTGLIATAAAIVLLQAAPAHADAIDGEWCSKEGEHFSIAGPQIVTPAGTHTQGSYSRHAFTYQVPAADPGGGSTVSMILMNETTLHLWIDAAPSRGGEPMEVWHRCSPSVRRDGGAAGPA